VIRQSLVWTFNPPKGFEIVRSNSAAHVSLSSIFNFQRTDTADAMSWPGSLLASGLSSVAHAALMISSNSRENQKRTSLVASSVAAVVGEGYLGRVPKSVNTHVTFF
jgi:hypothetical protein